MSDCDIFQSEEEVVLAEGLKDIQGWNFLYSFGVVEKLVVISVNSLLRFKANLLF